MSVISSTTMRAVSPHRQKLLSNVSRRESTRRKFAYPQYRILLFSNGQEVALFRTSCRCLSSEPEPSITQMPSTPEKNRTSSQRQGLGRGRGRGPQQVTVSKALQRVHLSSWAKGSLNNILGNFTAFSAIMPNRLSEEFNRLFRKVGLKKSQSQIDRADEQARSNRMHSVLAADETKEACRPRSGSKITPPPLPEPASEREEHTFEKAMEDTHHSITSYYHAYTTPQYPATIPVAKPAALTVPVTPTVTAPPPPPSASAPQPATTPAKQAKAAMKAAEEEVGWSAFRRLPFPFLSTEEKPAVKKKKLDRKEFVARSAVEARTRAIVASIKTASSFESKITRVGELCKHLKQYTYARHEATECKVVPLLLPLIHSNVQDLREEAMEALVLLGYIAPIKGRGIRVLTLDGGGTRGLMMLQCLTKMEELSNRRIYELFDYVCGVSTGALIACMTCLYRLPLIQCEKMYLEFSRQMFNRSRFFGTGGLVWNHSFYDSDQWEKILQTQIGSKTLIEFSRDPQVPKMSAVSTVMNTPRMKNFVFRNYNLPPNSFSAYPGSCTHKAWEIIRASSAAPGYYEDFPSGEYVHSDGGLSVNNPTALAIHESRLLWPNETIQCVVSLGTGRYEPIVKLTGGSKVSLKEKVSKIVDSATDTEAVHVMMTDLMPPSTYFRFNPYLSEDLQLDEIRQDRIDSMLRDTAMYLRKNEAKMAKAVHTLKQGRMPHQVAMDWVKYKVDCNF